MTIPAKGVPAREIPTGKQREGAAPAEKPKAKRTRKTDKVETELE